MLGRSRGPLGSRQRTLRGPGHTNSITPLHPEILKATLPRFGLATLPGTARLPPADTLWPPATPLFTLPWRITPFYGWLEK